MAPRRGRNGAPRWQKRRPDVVVPPRGHDVPMRFASPMVNIYTQHVGEAIAFYGGLLGFEETFRAPDPQEPEHVELRLDGVTIAVSTAEAARRVHGVEANPGGHGFQLVVWTEDVDTAYADLVA